MERSLILCLTLFVGFVIDTDAILRFRRSQSHHKVSLNINYTTEYFTVDVDHFNYANQDTFQLRYLVNDEYWMEPGGPIFFYAGNEGDIEMFCNNTGFMWDIAPEYNAMLIFAEHRYYGQSLPFGNKSYDGLNKGFLSAEQALADYAALLTHLKKKDVNKANSPVIVFGGSYGGMLAAWFRMKYPNIVQGAIAASAPVLWFGNMTSCDSFYQTVTNDFTRESSICAENVKKSWDIFDRMMKTDSGRVALQKALRLCKPLTGDEDIKDWIAGIYGNLAMVNYPYPANFLENLPAWPIKAVCSHMSKRTDSDDDLVAMVGDGLNVYFNSTGSVECFDIDSDAQKGLSDQGWSVQACTEMVMPMCATGVDDMFYPMKWDLNSYVEDCQKKYGLKVRPDWMEIQYWGKKLQAASNIVFSNGKLDPWSGGGVQKDISDTVVSVWIEEGAHHLDLRSRNWDDPPSVIAARSLETTAIQRWIEGHWDRHNNHDKFDVFVPLAIRAASSGDVLRSLFRTYIPVALGVVFLLVALLAIVFFINNIRKKQYSRVHEPAEDRRPVLHLEPVNSVKA